MIYVLAFILSTASVAISCLNWYSMPAHWLGQIVAVAIALGVEGSKLYLVPYSRVYWGRDRPLALAALVMGSVMTFISVGGIVIWLDNNLAFNAAAKAQVAQVDAIRDARIKAAAVLVEWEKASDAVKVLDKVDTAKTKQEEATPNGLTIPFDLSTGQRWRLLTGIALTVDLGALLMITIIWTRRKPKVWKPGPRIEDNTAIEDHTATKKMLGAFMDNKPASQWFALKPREEELKADILAGKFGTVLASKSKISKDFGIRSSSVKAVIDSLLASGDLIETEQGQELA